MMKRIIFLFLITIIESISTANYYINNKINYLKSQGIEFNKKVLEKKQLSRYEVIRYLNYARCFDCMHPPRKIKNKFNLNWFNNFKKQDRFYLNDISSNDKYYYCVVNLASIDYVHGYPKSNPICGGKFCGTNNMYFGELLQVVLNIISNKIKDKYYIYDTNKFYQNLISIKGTDKQKYANITNSEYKIIEKIRNSGKKIHNIKNFQEFFLYQKYCNLFPEDCNFKEYGKIKKGNYLLSLVNILYKENLLSLKDALNLNPQKIVSGKDLLNWLYKIKQINSCKIDNDYDKDGIENKKDNCIYTYNPNQKDTDKDKIGDVCDDDIDNDGIKNPIGIVDDNGNIVTSKLKLCKGNLKCDNCIFTKNTDQKDSNYNKIGDACEKKGYDLIGIKINCNPLFGKAPLKTKCIANTVGNIKKIIWTYKGNIIGYGKNISYEFLKKGYKKITATAIGVNNNTATANSYFKVGESEKTVYNAGLQIKAKPNSTLVGRKITFTKEIKGDLDYIRWNFGDGSIYKLKTSTNPIKRYKKIGLYKVLAEGIKNGKVVTKSYEYVKIYKTYKKNPTSYLLANPLQTYVGNNVKFNLITKNIDEKNIKQVVWNFGDNTSKVTKYLSTNHIYKNSGAFPITASIYLNDGTKIDNMITEKIISNNKLSSYGATLNAMPLKQYIGKKVLFKLETKGFNIKDIKSINWLYGDGTSTTNNKLNSYHTYYENGKKYVLVNITLKNNEIVTTSLTEVIVGNNICENLEKAKKVFHCDMDNDGIPDICDDDIDGDGIKNLIGIIKYEKKDCTIDKYNINVNRKSQEQNIAKKGGNIDNCPFKINPKQKDDNLNGIGNMCENGEDIIGIYIRCKPTVGKKPLKTYCKAYTAGNIKNIIWTYKGKKIGTGYNIDYIFLNIGYKLLKATAIGVNNDVANANNFLNVLDKEENNGYGASLSANPLKQYIGKNIKFSIIPRGFTVNDIKEIVWDFGDNKILTINQNPQLSIEHSYDKGPQKYPVKATIKLKNGKKLIVSNTVVITKNTMDSDGDGILDDEDACPNIPENKNGIEDLDGCPEIQDINDNPQFKVENCNTCPCQFADYAGPFVPGSTIKAILVNPSNPNIFYNISNGVQY